MSKMQQMPIAPATSVVTTSSNKLNWALGAVMVSLVGFGFYSSVSNENLVAINIFSQRNSSIDNSQQSSLPREENSESESVRPMISIVKRLPQQQYEDIKSLITKSKEDIWKYWDIDNFPLFLASMHIPKKSWNIQKQKFIKHFLQSPEYYSATNTSSEFIVGFSGSSVTAGHDNYFYEAYPQVFHDVLKPIFESLAIPFTVRNHALGNNPCYPYDSCLETHLGTDLDIVTWEQSMNCGRDSKPLESFTRAAVAMEKKPTIMFLASGTPSWGEKECENITSARSSVLTEKEQSLLKLARSLDPNSMSELADSSNLLEQFAFLRVGKETIHETYSDMAPMGESVLGVGTYKCLGPYVPSFAAKTPGSGAAWHPGKLGHKLRGDVLSYYFLSILMDALRDLGTLSGTKSGSNVVGKKDETKVEIEVEAKDKKEVEGKIDNKIVNNGGPVPSSVVVSVISPKISRVTSSELQSDLKLNLKLDSAALSMHNTAASTIEKFQMNLASINPISCAPEVCQTPPKCYTDYEPKVTNALSERIIGTPKNWTLEISFFDKSAVLKSIASNLGYIDRKNIHCSKKKGAELSISVNVLKESDVWLCECQKGFLKYPDTMVDLDIGASVYFNYNVDQTADKEDVRNSSTTTSFSFSEVEAELVPIELVTDQCYKTNKKIKPGNHIVTLVQKGVKEINLAYVLNW